MPSMNIVPLRFLDRVVDTHVKKTNVRRRQNGRHVCGSAQKGADRRFKDTSEFIEVRVLTA